MARMYGILAVAGWIAAAIVFGLIAVLPFSPGQNDVDGEELNDR